MNSCNMLCGQSVIQIRFHPDMDKIGFGLTVWTRLKWHKLELKRSDSMRFVLFTLSWQKQIWVTCGQKKKSDLGHICLQCELSLRHPIQSFGTLAHMNSPHITNGQITMIQTQGYILTTQTHLPATIRGKITNLMHIVIFLNLRERILNEKTHSNAS